MATTDTRNRGAWRQFLRQVPFFSGLDEVALEQVAAACIRRELPAKSFLFYEGDSGYCLYVIGRGTIQIRKEAAPSPLVVAERRAGEVIGELALLDGQPRSATAVTTTPCTLYELSRERFLECIQRRPELALGMLEVLTKRLREADDRLAQRLMEVEVRLAAFLLERVKQSTPEESGRVLLGKLTNAEIGRQIGATRETISRKMEPLVRHGIVLRDAEGLWILQPRKLQEAIG